MVERTKHCREFVSLGQPEIPEHAEQVENSPYLFELAYGFSISALSAVDTARMVVSDAAPGILQKAKTKPIEIILGTAIAGCNATLFAIDLPKVVSQKTRELKTATDTRLCKMLGDFFTME